MNKVAIITISDKNNLGNRLQNYALQKKISDEVLVETIWNEKNVTKKEQIIDIIKFVIKSLINIKIFKRCINFSNFEKNIIYSKYKINQRKINKKINKSYDYFVVGSDQVWNPNFDFLSDVELLYFVLPQKRISYAASFGVSNISFEHKERIKDVLKEFKNISVREDDGKKIVVEITGRKDVEVLVDPTMLLTAEEWDKLSKKPKMLKSNKFILNYFLGELSEQRKSEIDRIAKENDCEVINILDKNSPYYECGPSEFLYLEKNAFLICTDSFHSSVFAFIYNRPFIIFDREDKEEKMNSRLDTLISKFKLKNRKYNGENITKENLEHDYTEAYKILEEERKKSDAFLRKALEIKEKK